MAKIQKRYINQLTKVWNDLFQEAADAMAYVDADTDCDEGDIKILNKLQKRFDKAMAHIVNAE